MFYLFLTIAICKHAKTHINKSLGSRPTQLAVKCPVVIDKGMPPLLAGRLCTKTTVTVFLPARLSGM